MLLRVSEEKLQLFADKINFKVLLNSDAMIAASNQGQSLSNGQKIAPFEIAHRSDVTPLYPYEQIYCEYKVDPTLQKFYPTPFPRNIRLKLTELMIGAPVTDGGANVELRTLTLQKVIAGAFPLHEEEVRSRLKADWLTYCSAPWNQPVDAVKDYLGEKIALYFTFLGHYTTWLMTPALIGLVAQLVVAGTGNFSHPILPFYAILVALWSVFMLEFWKRKEKLTAFRWGMEDFESTQLDRPEFNGDGQGTIKSFIDGSEMLYFPPQKQAKLMCESFTIIGSLAALVLGAVICIYVIRRVMYDTSVGTYSSFLASVMNSVQITIFNIVYSKLADALTERENHRYVTVHCETKLSL